MTSEAEKEHECIERELDSNPPAGEPPVKQGGNSGSPNEPSRNNHLDAVIVGAVLLAAIAFMTMLGESHSQKLKTQLTATSMGGALSVMASDASSPDSGLVRRNRNSGCGSHSVVS